MYTSSQNDPATAQMYERSLEQQKRDQEEVERLRREEIARLERERERERREAARK